MYFVVVNSFRKKIAMLLFFASLWVFMYAVAGFTVKRNFYSSITIENLFSFHYPYSFHVDNLYSGPNNRIQANSPVVIPVVKNLSDFKGTALSVKFKYPPTFIFDEPQNLGSEILYHIDFRDSQGDARGFVQVWQLSIPMEQFLEQSKKTSMVNYLEFTEETFIDGARKWILWEYTAMGGNGNEQKGLEAFFTNNAMLYRVSYFVPVSDWDNEHRVVFEKMLKSFEIK